MAEPAGVTAPAVFYDVVLISFITVISLANNGSGKK